MERKERERLGLTLAFIASTLLVALVVFSFLYRDDPILLNNLAGNVGVPAAALTAFIVVILLLVLFPPKEQHGQIVISLHNAKLEGPVGPITLWVLCFVAIMIGIQLMKLSR
jgi:hypothetical protein